MKYDPLTQQEEMIISDWKNDNDIAYYRVTTFDNQGMFAVVAVGLDSNGTPYCTRVR